MTLFLLPNLLGLVDDPFYFLPQSVHKIVSNLHGLIAESEKEGRHFLRRFVSREKMDFISLSLLNEHTTLEEKESLLIPLSKGEKWGLISDCGLPCIADPGSDLVARAYELNIAVEALVGPSSIFMALMLSGLSGQQFAFHGYIARDEFNRKNQLKQWEKRAKEEKETQIFMDAPYRNLTTFQTILQTINSSCKLSIASNLTLKDQKVITMSIAQWKHQPLPSINKQPTLFLFL